MNVCDQYVGCGECTREQTVRDALDACFASWPQHRWVAFRCPSCGGANHLELGDGSVSEGYLDGAPGPSFVAKRRVRLDDFHVRVRGERAIEIRSLNLHWSISATPTGEAARPGRAAPARPESPVRTEVTTVRLERAIWYPCWYGLDQPLAVGETADLDFFKVPPDYVEHGGLRVLYHGDWQEASRGLYDTERRRVVGIGHPVLGQIRRIETDGLDYRLTMSDGRVLMVEAEETPGVVYEWPEAIADWRIFVDSEAD